MENPNWLQSFKTNNKGHRQDIDINFNGPGIVVISGSNDSGKTWLINQLKDFIMKNNKTVFSSDVFSESDKKEYMRAYRRCVGYGMLNGELRMPILHEGQGAILMEKIGNALMSLETIESGWPGLVLDTPLSGVSDIASFRICELIARCGQNRQIIITSRQADEAGFTHRLALAHGVNSGLGKLDFSGQEIKINVQNTELTTSSDLKM